MASDTKDRIMAASAELFRRNGYTGTGLKQIVAAANAPFGSLYHFFPGGKEQLGAEVIKWSGATYVHLFDAALGTAPDLATGIRAFFDGAAHTLRESGYADACPIATVALEVASTSEPLRQATADVFETWIAAGTESFSRFGLPAESARRLTISTLAALEGAFVLSRAMRSTEPLEVAGEAIVTTGQALANPNEASTGQ